MRQIVSLLFTAAASLVLPLATATFGGEKASYPFVTWEEIQAFKREKENPGATHQNSSHVSYRQNVCDRYDRIRTGDLRLRDALQGLELRVFLDVGTFFVYTDEGGIDPLDPGLVALLLDELGRRGGFTWRKHFGTVYGLPERPADAPESETVDWADLLHWSVETFDLSASWWDQTLDRLERGIAFQKPWFDGSIIMVQKESEPEIDDDNIQIWNWLRPFDTAVWIMTISTVIASGMAYQWLEYLSGHRRGRGFWQWLSDNVYLSAIAFPQNYEFQPRSAGARFFGVSISIWALVMTATYTANLASLLVDHKETQVVVESISDAIALDLPICVYGNTGSDSFLKSKYRQASRVPFDTELETYQALNDGQCSITLAYYQNWLGFEGQRQFNPNCDLQWVGRKVRTSQSGFATSADVGVKCSSLVGTVLDIFINELLDSGFIEDMWDQHYSKTRDINCDAINPLILAESQGADGRRRLAYSLTEPAEPTVPHFAAYRHHQRHLKAGRAGGSAGGVAAVSSGQSVDVDASTMTINQMAGTFILHWGVTAICIVIGYISRWYKHRKQQQQQRSKGTDSSSRSADGGDYTQWFFKHRDLFTSSKHQRRESEDAHTRGASSDEAETQNNPSNQDDDDVDDDEVGPLPRESWQQNPDDLYQTRESLRLTQEELRETKREMKAELKETNQELKEARKELRVLLKLLHDQQPLSKEEIQFY